MSLWATPPPIKIYEALGAIADGRVRLTDSGAEVVSSSRGKTYTVTYDPESNAIRSNDNGSYWQGYLGYPAIAFLMIKKILPHNEQLAQSLKGVQWKDLITKFKNDYDAVITCVKDRCKQNGNHVADLEKHVAEVQEAIEQLQLEKLGKRTLPPQGY